MPFFRRLTFELENRSLSFWPDDSRTDDHSSCVSSAIKCPEVHNDEDDQANTLYDVVGADQCQKVYGKQGCDGDQLNCCPPARVARRIEV